MIWINNESVEQADGYASTIDNVFENVLRNKKMKGTASRNRLSPGSMVSTSISIHRGAEGCTSGKVELGGGGCSIVLKNSPWKPVG